MNYKIIINTLGWVVAFEAVCMLLPLGCSLIYNEPVSKIFLICIALCAVIGLILIKIPNKEKSMYAKEGFSIVALSWMVISVFGALPFYLSGYIPEFTDALFETASGFTTTGASILTDIEVFPKGLLFWRSFTHWIGGMGVLVFLVAILPLSGGNNLYLIKAESPGPSVSKLVPKVKSTAKILYGIYIGLTLLQIILLLIGKMELFDAVTITFGTAGTGGFGTRNSSITDYSPYIQDIITFFMIIFGIDFSVYYLILIRRYKLAFSSSEVKVYLSIMAIAIFLITIDCTDYHSNVWDSLRHGAFQVASIMTTTGYSTRNFDWWPEFSKTILVVLMFVGACAGSTGGGIKVSRIIILFKSIAKEIKIAAHPKRTHKITMNGRQIEHETIRAVNVFMVAYLAIFVTAVLIISRDNFDFTTNFTAVAATINNIGPGLGAVGPMGNFSGFSNFSKIVLTFCMWLGRLEIFPMLILFSPYTWKK